jgi:hypothetical protein
VDRDRPTRSARRLRGVWIAVFALATLMLLTVSDLVVDGPPGALVAVTCLMVAAVAATVASAAAAP